MPRSAPNSLGEIRLDRLRRLKDLKAQKAARDAQSAQDVAARFPLPGDLAKLLDPTTVVTPALSLLDNTLVEVANGECERLIWSMSPQEGKSQRVSRTFPLWMLLRNPELRIVIASYELGVARRWSRAIRNDIVDHPELGLKVREDTAAAHEWQLLGHKGGLYAVGVSGGLTGRPADLMVLDDPLKGRAEADSEAYRENTWDWWTETARTRLAPNAPVVLVMTRWAQDDLAGRLIEQDPNWRVVNIPALCDEVPDPLGRELGEYLVSARGRTPQQWQQIQREVGERAWNALYQGRPSPAEGGMFKRSWWLYDETPVCYKKSDGTMHAQGMDVVIQSWDMTFKNTDGTDFVVGQVWGRAGATAHLLDQVRARLDFPQTCKAVQDLSAKWPQASLKLIEDKANGPAVISQLRKQVPGMVPVNPEGNKQARAAAVTPFVEAGNVCLPMRARAPWVGGLLEECVVGSTMILTRLGLKRADEVQVGDEVLTHLGRFRPITAISQRDAPETVEIQAKTLDPLVLTPDHPVFAMSVRKNWHGSSESMAPVSKGWLPAGEVSCRTVVMTKRGQIEPSHKPHNAMTFPVLSPDYELQEIDLRAWYDTTHSALTPAPARGGRSWKIVDDGETIRINSGRAIPLRYRQALDHKFGRVCGLYLAEGSYSTGRAFWSFNKKETDLIDEVRSFISERWGAGSYVNLKTAPHVANIAVSLPRMGAFFREFGILAPNKRIPPWAWDAPTEFIEGLIYGWLDGDGHKVDDGWIGTTVSPHLAWGVRALATRLHKWALLRWDEPGKPSMIGSRTITPRHRRFSVSLLDHEKVTHVYDGEHLGLWVKQTKRSGPATVHNFTVAEDQSYVTTGGAVHNCAAFPTGAHDDQVDALTQALARLMLMPSSTAFLEELVNRRSG